MHRLEEKSFTSHDGTEIFYRAWLPDAAKPQRAIVLLHRGHEHSGRVAHLVEEFNLPGFAWFAWDARGHGRSPGPRGYSPSFATLVRDLQDFVAHIAAVHAIDVGDIAVVAQSVGAVVAATWAHDYAPHVRCLVLASPAFKVKLYVPFARTLLRIGQLLRGDFFVNSYVKAKYLTHDPERIASFADDPLIARPISVNVLLALYETARRVVEDARAIVVPTQLLISGADWVVDQAPQHRFFERLGAPVKERHLLPGFFHDTLGEKHRAIAIGKARAFVLDRFNAPAQQPSLLDADCRGYTRDEADALTSPLPKFTPRWAYWTGVRMAVRLGALLSSGMRLGRRAGFDSGSMLDYVYRNQAAGLGGIGRLIDRIYLRAIGWRGIRKRHDHVKEMLQRGADHVRRKSMPLRVLDVAAGHGRSVIEAFDGAHQRPESVQLRDISALNVASGRKLIAEKGFSDIATFAEGDAFAPESVGKALPRPTLGLVSGLYELFPDNGQVRRSLAGLRDAIPPGGCLVYSGQPWHPQLEMIGRTLTSHRQGQPWVMRRRTQAELDQLVAAAGFRKIEQRIDEWGMFSVTLAERVA